MAHNAILVALSLGAAASARARRRAAAQPAAARPQRAAAGLLRAVRALGGDHRDRLPADPAAGRPRRRGAEGASGSAALVQLWLADLGLVFYTLFVVITWKYIGFGIILFLAGLQGVPQRAARGGGDRRRDELDDAALRHAAAARADDPHLGVPRDHRLDPALRPRLDHDRSAAPRARRRRWRRTWSTRASTACGSATRPRSP